MNLLASLLRTSRLALLALATLLLLSIALPGPSGAQSVGDCDADTVVCAIVIHDTCHDYPVRGCFREPVPMCIYHELHPPPPLPGWGAGIHCWLS